MTDKYDGPGDSTNTGTETQSSALPATFQLFDSDGKVIKSIPIDPVTNQAQYSMVADSKGGQTIQAKYSGGSGYVAGGTDSFTQWVGGSGTAKANTVNKVVAGAGIYVSSPNGQGIVTVSNTPVSLTPTTKNIYDVAWSDTIPGTLNEGTIGQFTAVGESGLNMRSRDGHSWTTMKTTTSTNISASTGQMGPTIPNGQVEFYSVGSNGMAYYTNTGATDGDGITASGQLNTKDGPITENLIAPFTFYNGGTATRGTTTSTVIAADYIVLTYTFTDGSDLDTRTRLTNPNYDTSYIGWSEGSSIGTFLTWGGDNTGLGQESVLIDLINFKQVFPTSTSLTIECRAGWYGEVGTQPVAVAAVLYKGGRMVKGTYSYSWTNPTATQTIQIQSIDVIVTAEISNSSTLGEHLANFNYNISTSTGEFN